MLENNENLKNNNVFELALGNDVWKDMFDTYNLLESNDRSNDLKISQLEQDISFESIDVKDLEIIKYNRKKYYLKDNQVYIRNRDRTIGSLFGSFQNGQIIELESDLKSDLESELKSESKELEEKKIEELEDLPIIRYNGKKYYLIKNKLYRRNRDRTVGRLFANYSINHLQEITIEPLDDCSENA